MLWAAFCERVICGLTPMGELYFLKSKILLDTLELNVLLKKSFCICLTFSLPVDHTRPVQVLNCQH